jgi:hypothetical protein
LIYFAFIGHFDGGEQVVMLVLLAAVIVDACRRPQPSDICRN